VRSVFLRMIFLRSSFFKILAIVDATRCVYCCQLSYSILFAVFRSIFTIFSASNISSLPALALAASSAAFAHAFSSNPFRNSLASAYRSLFRRLIPSPFPSFSSYYHASVSPPPVTLTNSSSKPCQLVINA